MLKIKDWNIEAITGYKPKTTFYTDFSIADIYGEEAIKDTFNRAFNDWQNDYVYFTELVMALNWKIWEHYKTDEKKAALYTELWQEADAFAMNNYTGDALYYFINTTD